MHQALQWARDETGLSLSGELENDTLLPLWEARDAAISGASTLNLSGLSRVDTAGLALILHLCAQAARTGQPMRVVGMSDNLSALAQLYNLPDSLLPSANI